MTPIERLQKAKAELAAAELAIRHCHHTFVDGQSGFQPYSYVSQQGTEREFEHRGFQQYQTHECRDCGLKQMRVKTDPASNFGEWQDQ